MGWVLVTGGAGFIGSHVTDFLIKLGYNVVVLDDLSGGFRENINKKAVFIDGSVTDKSCIEKIFETYTITYVFHLAAYAAENLSHFIRRFNYENNVMGSINLINAAILHNVKCFVFTSSIAAYGDIPSPMNEDAHLKPCDPYGIAKLTIELDLKAAHKMFGFNYIIFKPHNVYGERQNMEDKYRNVVTIFINQIMQNKPMAIFGDGEQTRNFSYGKDVAEIIARAVEMPEAYNESFNIGADEVTSVNALAKLIAEKFGVKPNIVHLTKRHEVKHAHADHSKIKQILGYKTMTPLEVGIEKTIAWTRVAGIRRTKEFTNIEIRKNLPEGWE